MTLCKFNVSNMMIWYMYKLWSNYRNKIINIHYLI